MRVGVVLHVRHVGRGLVVQAVLLVLLGLGCDRDVDAPRGIVGCELVVRGERGDVCFVSAEARLRVEEDGRGIDVSTAAREAWRCGDDDVLCHVMLRPRDAVLDEATEVRWERPEHAETLARSLVEDPDALRRLRARALLGRLAIARGAHEEAVATLRATSREAAALGAWTEAMRDAVAASHVLRGRLHRFAEAREELARVEPLAVRDPAMGIELRYHRGLVARDVGDLRGALVELEAAVRAARARQDERREREALGALARIYESLGRDEANDAWERLAILDGPSACAEADRATNRGWKRLLAAERGVGFEARGLFERAAQLYATECADPARVANATLNLALADWHEGRFDAAGARLAQVEGGDAAVEAWRAILKARLEPEAALTTLDTVVHDGSPSLAWRLAVERGRAWEARSVERALAAYREAEALVDRELAGVPLEGGRAGFMGRRDESVKALVRVALANGAEVVALEALRRSLMREARQLRARDRLEALDPVERAAFEEALGVYRRVRAEVSARAAEAWTLPADERAVHDARVAELEVRASAALDEAHARLGVAPAELGCVWGKSRWCCSAPRRGSSRSWGTRRMRARCACLGAARARSARRSCAWRRGSRGPIGCGW